MKIHIMLRKFLLISILTLLAGCFQSEVNIISHSDRSFGLKIKLPFDCCEVIEISEQRKLDLLVNQTYDPNTKTGFCEICDGFKLTKVNFGDDFNFRQEMVEEYLYLIDINPGLQLISNNEIDISGLPASKLVIQVTHDLINDEPIEPIYREIIYFDLSDSHYIVSYLSDQENPNLFFYEVVYLPAINNLIIDD